MFRVTASGLWDGRPSLRGIWVAHPDADTPERVIIRNDGTGASVIGALFQRERENPGPAFQVSRDAADALGMFAGAPGNPRRDSIAPPAGRRGRCRHRAGPAGGGRAGYGHTGNRGTCGRHATARETGSGLTVSRM